MKTYSFVQGEDIVLETKEQYKDLVVALLRGDIVFDEPVVLANDIENEGLEPVETLDILEVEDSPRFILTEAEQYLRSLYEDNPETDLQKVKNKFIEIYEILEENFHKACSTHIDNLEFREFDIATHVIQMELQTAKDALVNASMLSTKLLTNDLILG